MARTSWIGAVLAVLLAEAGWSLVSAGPDHSPTPSCSDLYRSLSPEERHAARDSAQAVQALESYIGQARLGRPLPANSNATAPPTAPALEGWLAGNYSRLQQLLDGSGASQRLGGSGTAMTAAKACLSARLHPDGFAGRPVMSILLNYFKRPQIVNRISAAMRKACDAVNVTCEMVVNVDNPEEAGLWADQAGFVVPVFSANLHESRGYNRAAKLARGRYLIIWQDDQLPNEQGTWLLDMIKVFDAYPQLGILGMNTYRLCKHTEMTNRYGWTFWDPDPKTGVKWSFAQHVDFAPMAIRASIYHELGGLDEGISRPGDCGIWGDWELTNRAWMDGWQVGFMFSDGRGGDGLPGGTHLGSSAEKCWGRQQHVAMHVFHRRYGVEWVHDPMCGRVWLLNMLHHKLGYGTCPYGTKETRFGNCTVPMAADMERARQEMAQLEAAARVRGSGTYSAHALESYIGQAKLGRPLPANSNATAPPTAPALEGWLAGNYSRLQQLLDGSGASQRLGGSSAAVTAAKTCLSARLHPDGFAGRPVVSILLNYFKRPGVIPRIAEAMRQSCDSVQIACEISVNVDNPHEAELWASQVRAFVPGFVMPAFSANLHEARGYNRAAKLARGRYLIIWQDDQFPPAHGKWLLDMIRVFDAYPQLGILGMNTYRLCKNREMTNRWGSTVWRVDPRTGVSWTFAQHVDFAPLAVRASIYHEVGGLDENTARPGDCGIWGDWELTSRAWMDGWQVGFMYVDGRGGDGEPGGTHLGSSAEKCWGRQQWVAMNLFARRFDHVNDPLCDRVDRVPFGTVCIMGEAGSLGSSSPGTAAGPATVLTPNATSGAPGDSEGGLLALPLEIIVTILDALPRRCLSTVRCVCKRFEEICAERLVKMCIRVEAQPRVRQTHGIFTIPDTGRWMPYVRELTLVLSPDPPAPEPPQHQPAAAPAHAAADHGPHGPHPQPGPEPAHMQQEEGVGGAAGNGGAAGLPGAGVAVAAAPALLLELDLGAPAPHQHHHHHPNWQQAAPPQQPEQAAGVVAEYQDHVAALGHLHGGGGAAGGAVGGGVAGGVDAGPAAMPASIPRCEILLPSRPTGLVVRHRVDGASCAAASGSAAVAFETLVFFPDRVCALEGGGGLSPWRLGPQLRLTDGATRASHLRGGKPLHPPCGGAAVVGAAAAAASNGRHTHGAAAAPGGGGGGGGVLVVDSAALREVDERGGVVTLLSELGDAVPDEASCMAVLPQLLTPTGGTGCPAAATAAYLPIKLVILGGGFAPAGGLPLMPATAAHAAATAASAATADAVLGPFGIGRGPWDAATARRLRATAASGGGAAAAGGGGGGGLSWDEEMVLIDEEEQPVEEEEWESDSGSEEPTGGEAMAAAVVTAGPAPPPSAAALISATVVAVRVGGVEGAEGGAAVAPGRVFVAHRAVLC
eukprot:XP_001699896.1 predicted protein [Chlamydomonas reinhardtii]